MKNFWQGLIFSSYHASLKLTSTFDGKSVLREVFFFFCLFFSFLLLKKLMYASNLGFGRGVVRRSVTPFLFSPCEATCACCLPRHSRGLD